MKDEPILLCQDCCHMMPGEYCARTFLADYVHGKHRHFSCTTERGSLNDGDCGPQARFWEPLIDSSIPAIPVKQVA